MKVSPIFAFSLAEQPDQHQRQATELASKLRRASRELSPFDTYSYLGRSPAADP